jgi:hypothetical protein
MSQRALADKLSELLATETRSLARHMAEASPYLNLPTYAIWMSLKHLTGKAQDHARRLSDLFNYLGLTPKAVSFDANVANYHYMGLDRLLPVLIEEKQRQVKAYEQAIAMAATLPHVKDELVSLEKENLEHLAQLVAARAKLTPPA